MNLYETTFIANQELTKKQIDLLVDSLEDILKSHESNVITKEYWGIRNFAYPIKKHKRGHYFMIGAKASKDAIEKIEKKLKSLEEIMKFLILKVDNIETDMSYLAKQENEGNV